MPQFDPTTMAPQIIWLIITFGFFYVLMAKLALPKIGEVLEERSERIADDLDQAEQLRREGETVQDNFQGGLAEARAKAQKILADARASAQKELDEKSRALDAKLNEQAEQADARIMAEKQKALSELENVAAEVTQDIIAKLLGSDIKVNAEKAVKAELSKRKVA